MDVMMNFVWNLRSGDRALNELKLQKDEKEAIYEDEISKIVKLMEEKGIQTLLETISISISWGMMYKNLWIRVYERHYSGRKCALGVQIIPSSDDPLKLLAAFISPDTHIGAMSCVIIFWSMLETCWTCSHLLSHGFGKFSIGFPLVPCKELSTIFSG